MTKRIVCFGEVLWDVLPTGKIAGGAPMNVSIRLQSLGVDTKMISKIGSDALGAELLTIIAAKGVDTTLIQSDETLPTGEVLVTLNDKGSASYDIVYPSAWDTIEHNEANQKAVAEADAFVFGSLVCRDLVSRTTLLALLEHAQYKVFDVNIRPPFYSIAFLKQLMDLADFIKLNDEELLEVAIALGSKGDTIESHILFLSEITNTKTICVTKGKEGAVLYIDNHFFTHNGFAVEVADTIGAGDSFLAALLSKVLYTKNYQESVTFACAVGALVASHKGANPEITSEEIQHFIQSKNANS